MSISYTAVVLDEKSKTILEAKWNSKSLGSPKESWKVFCHHATICMGELKTPEGKALVGQKVTFQVVSFLVDDKVACFIALKPDFLAPFITNEHFHVTAAVNVEVGGKPFMSNKLIKDKIQDVWAFKPFELSGVIEEVPNK